MNFYCFHINDFHGKTWHLDNLARWIYRDLIGLYYLTEKPLVGDLDELAHKIHCRADEEKTALREVLAEFFTFKKGKYHHSRIDREIKNYQYRHNKPAMMKRLTELGVAFDKGMSVAELSALLAMYDDEHLRNARNESNDLRNVSNAMSNEPRNELSNGMSNESNAMSNAQRQALHRQKQRESLLLELRELGVNPDKSMSLNGLKNFLEKVRNDLSNGVRNEPRNELSNGENLRNGESNGKNSAITINQEPLNIQQQQQQSRETEKNFSPPETSIDLPAPSPFDRFAMHGNWQPADLDTVNGLLRRAKLPAYETGLILDAALDFVAYWAGRPEVKQTAAQWDSEFVRSAVKYRTIHGHKYDPTTWELQQIVQAQPAAVVAQSAPYANTPSKTKQSVMILQAVREKVVAGSLQTVLSPKICLALVDGLLDLLGGNLKFPPAADVWELTLTTWANEFGRYDLGDDDVARVQTAFQAAKAKAMHPDNPEKRFPDVADVLACLPMKFVPKQLEHKLSAQELAQQAQEAAVAISGLRQSLSSGRVSHQVWRV